ncbi:O-antigen ligase [Chryseobacterium sp. MDT2-18]|uniref:O-antigen ligase family protein n=1 Tax=Chryseobacterium sp. MDT2-18 TaxID=1259136 RepID=UPI0027808FBB|nr:O-antigen ligase family protein [Chryseobacterium sp. MDT2-18]MDQ0476440.1 hypothetical protein [Chryseobacterium sp. MDT2-18]
MLKKVNTPIKVPMKTYVFVLSILAFTGFEYFYRADILLIPIVFYSLLIFFHKGFGVNSSLLVVLMVSILSLLQTLFGFNQNIFIFFITSIFFLGYFLIARITKYHFAIVYDNLMFIISLISLVFFFLTYNDKLLDFFITNVAVYFHPLNIKSNDPNIFTESTNILIYNFKNFAFSYNRNSGPFWEPGMYAVFLNFALFFNFIRFKRLFSFKNIVFIATIITTFSTTGYLGMFFTFITFNLFYSRSKLRLIYIAILLLGSYFVFQLDFLQSKIVDQLQSADSDGASRFGALLIHLQVIGDYPFIGVGEGTSRFIGQYTNAESTANGITLVFVKYGIPFGLCYYILLLKSCKNIVRHLAQQPNKYLGYCLFILFLILAFSQDITIRHFYLFLIFWGLAFSLDYKQNNDKKYKIINNAQ